MIFFKKKGRGSGFTLIEITLVIAIITMMAGLVLGPLSQFRAQKTLDAAVEEVFAAFSRAQIDTISSLHDSQYGVHLEADKIVYFVGTTYDSSATTNSAYELNTAIEIGSISLNPGPGRVDVVFERLSGGTSNFGTFEIRVKSDVTRRIIVTVNGTGAVSL